MTAGSREVYRLVFDGGSKGNPGPAYGSFRWQPPRGAPWPVERRDFGEATNNEAEYRTLIAALEYLLGRLAERGTDPSHIHLEIRGDSRLVLSQVEGTWKTKEPRLRSLRDQARDLLRRFGGYRLIHQPREATVAVLRH